MLSFRSTPFDIPLNQQVMSFIPFSGAFGSIIVKTVKCRSSLHIFVGSTTAQNIKHMKKLLLSLLSITLLQAASAQLTITLDGNSTDISGTIYDHELTSAVTDEHIVDFIVNNETGSDQSWKITRVNITNPAGWEEYICWGLNGAIGNCYLHDPNNTWSSNNENILTDSSGRISTYITCSTPGTAVYRYYVSTDGINFVDSIDLRINNVLGVEEKASLSVSVSPNPATDNIVVATTGVTPASVKVVDVLGNVVLNETVFTNKKNIDVTRFRNGVYFVIIEAEGVNPVTRKVIVRH